MPQMNVATALDLNTEEVPVADMEVSEQLINDYKTLNEKVDQTLQRINKRKQEALKK